MIKLMPVIGLSVLILVSGCSTIQTSSGRSYLERYEPMESYSSKDKNLDNKKSRSINQLIRQAAAVEPTLEFPARIGLARIGSGYISTIPADELEAWDNSRQKLGSEFGEFIPVNPMIANMVAKSLEYDRYSKYHHRVVDVMNKIRLGAARQHLDAVLIYEVYSREDSKSNILSIANLTIIGASILPSKLVSTEGFANAMLVDVIQGYPYGTAEASLDKSEMTTTFGVSDKKQQLSDEIKSEVTVKLTEEVEIMFRNLQLELLRSRSESKTLIEEA